MKIGKKFCYNHSTGEDIYLFTLRNKGTEVLISNYGAIITSYKILQPNSVNDIVLGFDKMEDYLGKDYLKQYPWFGCAVGRYANRIRNAEFELEGKIYSLTRNRAQHQLHGGSEGFDKKIWQLQEAGEEPMPYLELSYLSKDGEEGYPGNLNVRIRYELKEPHELSYQFRATTDAPTPINLTHHSYFNLNNGAGTIQDHKLYIPASKFLEQDNELVVTGNYLAVENTAHDFRKLKLIGDGLKKTEEFDQSFVLDSEKDKNGLRMAAVTSSFQSNLQLEIYTTEPVVHFYSGKWTPEVIGKNNQLYGPFSGFCLETHIHPNAVNIPQFPNTILRPDEDYFQKTIYRPIHVSEK
jgi:aldose 1-epimerase